MNYYFEILFFTFCLVQLVFQLLALMIRNRFLELDYEIKANPYFSVLLSSKFWDETRETNRDLKDQKINSYLLYRKFGWFFIIAIIVVYLILL